MAYEVEWRVPPGYRTSLVFAGKVHILIYVLILGGLVGHLQHRVNDLVHECFVCDLEALLGGLIGHKQHRVSQLQSVQGGQPRCLCEFALRDLRVLLSKIESIAAC
eukprot:scaffold106928_cov20-Tisochrysis_lutea.AAC.2